MQKVDQLDLESERLYAVIRASEPWHKNYEKDADSLAKLIKAESKMDTAMRKYLRGLANERMDKIILWSTYHYQSMMAFDVTVTIDYDQLGEEVGLLITTLHDPILAAITSGAQAGEAIYSTPLGMTETTSAVMKAAEKKIAKLVTGINTTTRDKIRQSISTSLTLGEDQATASARLIKVINDPYRAGMIARTEAVNSYSTGLHTFGGASGAVGKQWQSVPGACAICEPLDNKTAPIDGSYPGDGGDGPAAHPNCRCGERLIYQNEVDDGLEFDS